MRAPLGPIFLAAALGLATGCGIERPPARPMAGSPAPAFAAVTLSGDTVSLASLEGRPVLLNLWATWCAPCRRETPYLQTLHEQHGPRGLEIVGVSMDSRAAARDVESFVREFGVGYRVLHDPDGRSMDLFSAIGLPATYLIGRDGTILWSRLGEVREGEHGLEEALEAALADVSFTAEPNG